MSSLRDSVVRAGTGFIASFSWIIQAGLPAKSRLPYSYQEHEQGGQQRQPRDSHQLSQIEVAVPFILYLVRFCSSKSCKNIQAGYCTVLIVTLGKSETYKETTGRYCTVLVRSAVTIGGHDMESGDDRRSR